MDYVDSHGIWYSQSGKGEASARELAYVTRTPLETGVPWWGGNVCGTTSKLLRRQSDLRLEDERLDEGDGIRFSEICGGGGGSCYGRP